MLTKRQTILLFELEGRLVEGAPSEEALKWGLDDTYDDWFRDNWDPVNRCLKGLPDDIGSQLDVNETCVDALSDNDDEDWEFYWVKD